MRRKLHFATTAIRKRSPDERLVRRSSTSVGGSDIRVLTKRSCISPALMRYSPNDDDLFIRKSKKRDFVVSVNESDETCGDRAWPDRGGGCTPLVQNGP